MDSFDKLIKAIFFTQTRYGWGLPVLFWGNPGIGKTARLAAISRRYGFPLRALSPGLLGEGAFGVIGVPHGEGKAMRIQYPAPRWTEEFEDADCGVVFVDEISTAPAALHPPLLGLLLDRKIGDYQLGPRVRIIAAGNPPETAANGLALSPPVANRILHLDWESPTPQEWADWLQNSMSNPNAEPVLDAIKEEEFVKKNWDLPFAQAVGLISAFVTARGELLHKQPPETDPRSSKAWPSPRTWEFATYAYASALLHKLDESDKFKLVQGFVGEGACSEFQVFCAEADLPNPHEVLSGKIKWKHNPSRLDVSMAVISSCALYVGSNAVKSDDKQSFADVLWGIIDSCVDDAADIIINPANILIKHKLSRSPAATKALTRVQPVMIAAGKD